MREKCYFGYHRHIALAASPAVHLKACGRSARRLGVARAQMLDTGVMASALSSRLASSGACSRQSGPTARSVGNKQLLQAARQRPAGRTQPVRAIAEPPTRTARAAPSQNGAVPSDWAPDSWKRYTAHQQPNYPDKVLDAPSDVSCCGPVPEATDSSASICCWSVQSAPLRRWCHALLQLLAVKEITQPACASRCR